MILSQKKASAALKPWWDIIYGHGLLALLGLGMINISIIDLPWYHKINTISISR